MAAKNAEARSDALAKSTNGRIPKAKKPKAALAAPLKSKGAGNLKANNSASVAPDKSTSFKGSGSSHKKVAAKPKKRSPEEQRAEIERVAKEHGADLSEEGFNQVLRKVGSRPT